MNACTVDSTLPHSDTVCHRTSEREKLNRTKTIWMYRVWSMRSSCAQCDGKIKKPNGFCVWVVGVCAHETLTLSPYIQKPNRTNDRKEEQRRQKKNQCANQMSRRMKTDTEIGSEPRVKDTPNCKRVRARTTKLFRTNRANTHIFMRHGQIPMHWLNNNNKRTLARTHKTNSQWIHWIWVSACVSVWARVSEWAIDWHRQKTLIPVRTIIYTW